ncbi:unnamed protein product, partial [Medioppia subpectinata]
MIDRNNQMNYIQNNNNIEKCDNYCIVVNEMSANWKSESTESTIKNISMNAKSGDLIVVIGPVGAGKTTFLMSLLNELSITGGSVTTNGSIGYVSQESWVFNASVVQNIVFGKQYNEKRFREVIAVCALDKDLDSLPFRDNTIVGERGVLL